MTKKITILAAVLMGVSLTSAAAAKDDGLIAKLKALPNVSSVEKTSLKDFPKGTYVLKFCQPIDHKHPELGTFDQRVTLAVEHLDSMMLVVTEGYYLPPVENSSYRNELSAHYKTNQIRVEHRYCGESVPAGDSLWTYNYADQAAADQHVVTESLKHLFHNKWLTTGASKSGYTTVLYRYFYPNDVDVSVPFVAPFTFTLHDPYVQQYLETQSGTPEQREAVYNMVRRVFRSIKALTPLYAQRMDSLGLTKFMHGSVEDYFANDILDLTVGLWMYEDPNDFVKKFPTASSTDEEVWQYLSKRLEGQVFDPHNRFAPYMVQASRELGLYGFDFSRYKDLYEPKIQGLCDCFFMPRTLDAHPYDDTLFKTVENDFLPNTDTHILFIYGKDDPWSGDAIPDRVCTDNVKKYYLPGNHCTEIFTNALPEQRKEIVGTLDKWLYGDRAKLNATLADSSKFISGNHNPILDFEFTADPTAVEYNGRLYVYGTNDHEQFDSVGVAGKNSYEKIKSLAMMSTDDMVNWTYHGLIPTGKLAPWIMASWAPSICKRQEADGKTHFYLYFSNSGFGVGCLTATSPVGPWTSPLDHSVVDAKTPGLGNCHVPFDPGVVAVDDTTAYLAFGAGNYSRIAKLGKDMTSFASEITALPVFYLFEANELNYIDSTFFYTYNMDWSEHQPWNYPGKAPGRCCMTYMTSKDPLNINSWTYQHDYVDNPGDYGMDYGNNHTHLHKYSGKWYLFNHAQELMRQFGTTGGFRSMTVDEITVDEKNHDIHKVKMTRKGVSQIKNLNPFQRTEAETVCATNNTHFENYGEAGNMVARIGSKRITNINARKGMLKVSSVDFANGASQLTVNAKGKGTIEVREGSYNGKVIAKCNINSSDYNTVTGKATATGLHDIYFIMEGPSLAFDYWMFK